MKNNRHIQVFEHQQLSIGTHGFEPRHWTALGWYNETHGSGFFTLTPTGVKFNQHVGVIQVSELTIEVLPKISRQAQPGDKKKWQRLLIDMLQECTWMSLFAHEKANLRLKPRSILEAYLDIFLRECEQLVKQGLIKKYRQIEKNGPALKGKLIFSKHARLNLVHKERFYTRQSVFDRENLYNQLLLMALKLIPSVSPSPYLKDRVYNLLLRFPDLSDISVNSATFSKLVFDRKTQRYKEAIEIAQMLLLNFRPDVSAGHNHVLAILFDMNDLWEEFIFRRLSYSKPTHWELNYQDSRHFWKPENAGYVKTIRPDITVYNRLTEATVVIDTKWKLPDKNIPDDADLKQMFVYNEYWKAQRAILLYPGATYSDQPIYTKGVFVSKDNPDGKHACIAAKISPLNSSGDTLETRLGKRLWDFLEKEFNQPHDPYNP